MDITELGAQAVTELFHYGVKGMKWGVRRDRSGRDSGPEDVTIKTTPGKKVQTRGGRRQEVSEDAVKTAISKQKAKSSTTDALSTKELQELVTRMNLEQQYSRLSEGQQSAGKKFVSNLLLNAGKQQAQAIVNQQVSTIVQKKMQGR
jgi:hypothetical protein